jgi:hypothetical protein
MFLALRHGLITSSKVAIESLEQIIADFSQQKLEDINQTASDVLKFVKNFE